MIFYIAEISASPTNSSAGTTLTLNEGHGVNPRGTYSQFADTIAGTATVFCASDMGYRTSPADGTVTAYPPLISEAFAIDRRANLDPTSSSIAAAWGTLSLSNATSQFDSIVSNFNNDGRNLSIKYGVKVFENGIGTQSGRSTTGTYIDANGVMQIAPAYTLRNDYATGSGIVLNEPSATNLLANTHTMGSLASNGDSMIS